MSSFIGTEILPNIYIDNVRIYDGSIKFCTYVFDRNEQPMWSDNDLSKKDLKIKILCSFDEQISTDIINGSVSKLESFQESNSNVLTDMRSVLYCMLCKK